MTRLMMALCLSLVAGEALAQSLIANRAIRAREVLTEADLSPGSALVPGAVTALADAVGREARVTLYPGRPIMKADLVEPAEVERNQLVQMYYRAGALQIVTEGRVLDRAGTGSTVRVMNLSSRQIVSGIVQPGGTVAVLP